MSEEWSSPDSLLSQLGDTGLFAYALGTPLTTSPLVAYTPTLHPARVAPPLSQAPPPLAAPTPLPSTSTAPITTAAPMARKRKATTRTRTGCRVCRSLHIRCIEGPIRSVEDGGGKIVCRRCWETDSACMYPRTGATKRRRPSKSGIAAEEQPEEQWEAAVSVDVWPLQPAEAPTVRPAEEPARASELDDSNWTSLLNLFTHQSPCPVSPQAPTLFAGLLGAARLPPPTASLQPSASIAAITEDPDDSSRPDDTSDAAAKRPVADRRVGTVTRRRSPIISSLFSPQKLMSTWTLAELMNGTADRSAVSYFEAEGCDDIVATYGQHNWIFSELFPRVLDILNTGPPGPKSALASNSVYDFVKSSLLYLSYVHRGNVELDPERSLQWKSEGRRWAQKGSVALLKANLSFPKGEWRSNSYLMGFFIRCMADMLDGAYLHINSSSLPPRPPADALTPFQRTLWDFLSVYATHIHAFTPFNEGPITVLPIARTRDAVPRLQAAPLPSVDTVSQGATWVDSFFGFSRYLVRLVSRVNDLIGRRVRMLENYDGGHLPPRVEEELHSEVQQLLAELDSDEFELHQLSQQSRVRRGNETVRAALRVMLLCEVLNVDLDDERIHAARRRVVELVADAEMTGLGGFHWQLTMVAIYCRDVAAREEAMEVMSSTLLLSFGRHYRTTKEILTLCWDILDAQGGYENGIAPWREGMHALGTNLWF